MDWTGPWLMDGLDLNSWNDGGCIIIVRSDIELMPICPFAQLASCISEGKCRLWTVCSCGGQPKADGLRWRGN